MKKKRILAFLLAALMLSLSGCSGTGESLRIKEEAPLGTVDTVAPEIRSFIEAAQNYVEGDYSYSEKSVDDLGNLSVPVSFSWQFSGDEKTEDAKLLISKEKDMSSPLTIALSEGSSGSGQQSVDVYNLETGAQYYWCVEASAEDGSALRSKAFSFDTKDGPRVLNIPGVENARDLGGWKTADGRQIKEGIIYRSADLDDLTPEGEDILTENLGIKTELDLRNHAVENVDSPIADKVNHINIPLLSYTDFLRYSKSAQEAARVFTVPDNYPVLFHCVAGADRTGCLAFLLGALCGVNETDLVTDYELTPGRYRMGTSEDNYDLDFPAFAELFRTLPGDTYKDKAHWFLKHQCELSDMELYNIVAIMTGDAAVFADPPQAAVKITDGKAEFEIDSRLSGSIKSVSANGIKYQYSYENGLLTVMTNDTEETAAVLEFSDGTQMPLVWRQ